MKNLTFEQMPVLVKKDNGANYFDATAVAKKYGKKTNNWMRSEETKAYIEALAESYGANSRHNLILKGRQRTATWIHEDLLVCYARWVSPHFAVWCDRQIKTLLLDGTVSIHSVADRERHLRYKGEYNEIRDAAHAMFSHVRDARKRAEMTSAEIDRRVLMSDMLPNDYRHNMQAYYAKPITYEM